MRADNGAWRKRAQRCRYRVYDGERRDPSARGHAVCIYSAVGQRCMQRLCPKELVKGDFEGYYKIITNRRGKLK